MDIELVRVKEEVFDLEVKEENVYIEFSTKSELKHEVSYESSEEKTTIDNEKQEYNMLYSKMKEEDVDEKESTCEVQDSKIIDFEFIEVGNNWNHNDESNSDSLALDSLSDQLELNQTSTPINLPVALSEDKEQGTLFGCIKCESLFKSNEELKAHSLTHGVAKEKPTCDICDKTFLSMTGYKLHAKKHSREKEHKCNICGAQFTKTGSLTRHLALHSEEKTYRCTTCGASYRTEGQLRWHLKEHKKPERLTEEETLQPVDQLPRQTNSAFEKILVASVAERDRICKLRLNKKNNVGDKEHKCHFCGAQFTKAGSLTKHMTIHSEDQTFCCNICGTSYCTESQLRRHSKEHKKHSTRHRKLTEEETLKLAKKLPDQANSESEKILIAAYAERDRISKLKNSEDKDNFEQGPLYLHQCSYCPKSFKKPSDLVRHLRMHTGERPYECNFCNKRFTLKSTLNCHIKTHNSEKQWACHVCSSKFATSGSLKTHMRVHTGSRPYLCPFCDKRFRTSGHRKGHVFTHVKEAKFKKYFSKETESNTKEQDNLDVPQIE